MNHVLKCNCSMAEKLREVVPVQGVDWVNLIRVELKQGESVRSHNHPEHTALYYPEDCEPISITPTAGLIIYLPPGTQHAVPAVSKQRTSVALLVQEPKAHT